MTGDDPIAGAPSPENERPGASSADATPSGRRARAGHAEGPGRASGRRRATRVVAWLAFTSVALPALYLAANLLAVWRASRTDETRRADAIVVLGAAQYWGRPSPVLERRLRRGLELYRRGLGRVIVTTGAGQAGDRVTEGYAGYRFLRQRGVPERDILVVVHGTDTWEELSAAANVLSSRGMSTVLLVSDPYHSYRAKRCAVETGLVPFASPTDGAVSWPNLGRETAAVALGRVIGFRRVSTLR